jgi:hypothetical protein
VLVIYVLAWLSLVRPLPRSATPPTPYTPLPFDEDVGAQLTLGVFAAAAILPVVFFGVVLLREWVLAWQCERYCRRFPDPDWRM